MQHHHHEFAASVVRNTNTVHLQLQTCTSSTCKTTSLSFLAGCDASTAPFGSYLMASVALLPNFEHSICMHFRLIYSYKHKFCPAYLHPYGMRMPFAIPKCSCSMTRHFEAQSARSLSRQHTCDLSCAMLLLATVWFAAEAGYHT